MRFSRWEANAVAATEQAQDRMRRLPHLFRYPDKRTRRFNRSRGLNNNSPVRRTVDSDWRLVRARDQLRRQLFGPDPPL